MTKGHVLVGYVGLCALLLCASPAWAQIGGRQIVIEEVQGKWQARDSSQRTRAIGTFDVLTTVDKVRCSATPCTLFYATVDGSTKPLPLPQPATRLGQWVGVAAPADSSPGPAPPGLQELIAKIGSRGGRRKDTPVCSGSIRLLTPGCGELIDPAEFKLQWSRTQPELGKTLTVLVGGTDSSQKRRWNSIDATSGEFQAQSLNEYLTSLELPDRSTDVTIRLMRSENLDAIRLVRLPSRAEDSELRGNLRILSALPPLSRHLQTLEKYLGLGMWSKAAELSQQLLRNAPDSPEIRKFALVGFCRSDFADDIAQLRSTMKDSGNGLCSSDDH
jgi:hypothetical protein